MKLVLGVAIAITLMVVDHRRHDSLQQLRDTVAIVNYPIQLAAETPGDFIKWTSESISNYNHLLDENRRLNKENLLLQGGMQRFKALEEENQLLRDQLGASLRVGERVTLAEMTKVDLSPYRQQIWINRGSNAGVFTGQAVIDAHAIMGQVIEVTPFRSAILLITDTLHSIPVQVLRTGLRTVAKGTGRINNLELPYLPRSADVRVGDLLVSSGLGGRYPSDYPVARITSVGRDPNGATTIAAAPLARLAVDEQVMLVWSLDEKLQAVPVDEPAEEPAEESADEPVNEPADEPADEAEQGESEE
ncbi:rod shape-determining protein MreC [Solemya velum gill symbiont]|uniref:rod shape-determining protein MreC n=1 Tax=Solemya velum gill symbiont TaxID=2340 RepID=UPI00211963F1|nr:rod shape-determining protein MreC [Solemya velum gill symbiont]